MKSRKVDRRTTYTIQVIKDALLELMHQQSFDKITVSSLCRKAEITRTTFYLHFSNLTDVLNEVLKDALQVEKSNQKINEERKINQNESSIEELRPDETLGPIYQRIAHSPKYYILLTDDTLTRYLLNKIYQLEKDHIVPILLEKYNLTKEEAELIFRFTLFGSFSVNKKLNWEKDDKWYKNQKTIMRFIMEGLNHF